MLGREDEAIVRPAVEALRDKGIDVAGPLPADTMFHPEARATYDAALCMYHDQALIPVEDARLRHGGERHARPSLRAHLARPRHGARARRKRQGTGDEPDRRAEARARPGRPRGRPLSDDALRAAALEALPPLRDVIAAHGLAARKALGQNFLLDLNLTRRIARAGGPLADSHVVEIGPGPGGLTRALLMEGAAHVTAIERDRRALPALAEMAAAAPGRLTIVEGDALTFDYADLDAGRPLRIVANLPYNIATPLLVGWLTGPWPPFWESLTLMFQREVADRIVAAPGSKAYGRLAVLAQWRAQRKRLFDVPARAFTPPPKVTSAVVRLEPRRRCDRPPAARRRSGHRRRLRPAAQDAALEPEAALAGPRADPGGGRHRADAARRGSSGRQASCALPRTTPPSASSFPPTASSASERRPSTKPSSPVTRSRRMRSAARIARTSGKDRSRSSLMMT